MSGLFNLDLQRLLGRGYLQFMEEIAIPAIEARAEQDTDNMALKKTIGLVRTHGINVLRPMAQPMNELTANQLEDQGYLLVADVPLVDHPQTLDDTLKLFIKRSSRKEDFGRVHKLQNKAAKALDVTPYSDRVPKIPFVQRGLGQNQRSQKITLVPFAEGEPIFNVMHGKTDAEKKVYLEQAIDEYVEIFAHLNKDWVSEYIDFPASNADFVDDFNQGFVDRYCDGDVSFAPELVGMFKEQIGDRLNAARRFVFHGDFHGKNVLYNDGKCVFLDWPNAGNNGYPEYDIAKLVRKANVSLQTEDELAAYAERVVRDRIPSMRPEHDLVYSADLHRIHQIMIDLNSSKRYLQRANNTKLSLQHRSQLQTQAQIIYNTAIRRMERAVEADLVSLDFIEQAKANPPREGNLTVSYVPDSWLEKLTEMHDPHDQMSQENMRPPSTDMDDIRAAEQIDMSQLRKGVVRAKARRTLSYAAALVIAVAAVSYVAVSVKQEEQNQQMREYILAANWGNTPAGIAEEYSDLFREALRKTSNAVSNDSTLRTFEIDDPVIDSVAVVTGLDSILAARGYDGKEILRGVINTNRIFTGFYSGRTNWAGRIPDNVQVTDPFQVDNRWYDDQILDPYENLMVGAERLAGYCATWVDIPGAIGAFYTFGPADNSMPPRDPQENFMLVRKHIDALVQTVLEGPITGSDVTGSYELMRSPGFIGFDPLVDKLLAEKQRK